MVFYNKTESNNFLKNYTELNIDECIFNSKVKEKYKSVENFTIEDLLYILKNQYIFVDKFYNDLFTLNYLGSIPKSLTKYVIDNNIFYIGSEIKTTESLEIPDTIIENIINSRLEEKLSNLKLDDDSISDMIDQKITKILESKILELIDKKLNQMDLDTSDTLKEAKIKSLIETRLNKIVEFTNIKELLKDLDSRYVLR